MRRRDFIMLAGGALAGAAAAPLALARTAPSPAHPFGPWGFDKSGADFAVRPGDGFFRHANGGWLDRTPIAPDRSVNGVDIVVRDEAEAHIRAILERGAAEAEPALQADAAKIGALYANFMDEARAERLDATPLAPYLDAIRAAATHADLARLMGQTHQAPYASVFDLAIDIDSKAPDRYTVIVSQGGLGLPNRDYYLQASFAGKKAAYRDYIAQLLSLIDWPAPQNAAAAILEFESAIAEASWPLSDSQDSEKVYNPMGVAALAAAAPFPWDVLLGAAELAAVERAVVAEVTAIPKIAAIVMRSAVDTLKAWQAFHAADAAAPFLSGRFDRARFEFNERTLSGVAELAPRWKRGVRIVEAAMGEAVGRIYVARHVAPETKPQIDALVGRLRDAFKARIERVAWMTPQTRLKALDKLARLNAKIGYPRRWRDYSALAVRPDDLLGNVLSGRRFEWLRRVRRLNRPVERDEWEMTPQTVDALYSSNRNEITLPAAILQAPFFDPAADLAVNYGAIGALIGHELTHGFDDDGRKFDGAGILSNWWTEADVAAFTRRADVLKRQFDAIEPFPGLRINGELTLGENIADLGGVLIALDGYRLALGGRPAPAIDGLTGEQRFFLSYAQSWRVKRTEDSVKQNLVSDPHAPAQYRVDGVVCNVDAWYSAFDVKPNDKLYLADADRVRIW